MADDKKHQEEGRTAWSQSTLEALKRMGFNHPDYDE
jgi:hypothetical protein